MAKKTITLDDLAIMVAQGFENAPTKHDFLVATKRIEKLEQTVGGLKNNVNSYLELSEKRYSELKQRDALLAGWLKPIADKAKVQIDVSQLEKI